MLEKGGKFDESEGKVVFERNLEAENKPEP